MGAKLVSQKCLDTLHNSMLHNGCTHTHTHTHTHTNVLCPSFAGRPAVALPSSSCEVPEDVHWFVLVV